MRRPACSQRNEGRGLPGCAAEHGADGASAPSLPRELDALALPRSRTGLVLSVLPFCVCQEVIDVVKDIQSLGEAPKCRMRGSRVFLGKGLELFVLLGV